VAEPLSAADRSSLAAEQGAINMAVGGLLVFDGGLTRNVVKARVRERLHLVPRLRQKLADPARGLANPVWVDDTHFDLDWHVAERALPAPGDEGQLAPLVGDEMGDVLDRNRPLWRLFVIAGHGDRVAVLFKLHHAIADGLGAIAAGALLLDPTEEPMEVPAPEREWSPRGYDLRRHLTNMATSQVSRAQRMLLQGAARAFETTPRRAATDVRRTTELLAELARTRPQAPMTPLNEPIGKGRRFAVTHAGLPEVKAAARRTGGTVNDVILAVVAGMLRRYLRAAGWDVERERDPVALVPVSVRRDDADSQLGNRISMVFVDLPVREPDPGVRVRTINAETSDIKRSAAVRAGALVVGAGGWAPPLVSGMVARAMGSVRGMNLVVSNVPGPQQPFFLAGSRLREVYPIVPLNPANQGMSVGVLSYDGGVFFGLLAQHHLEPPLDVAAAALREAMAELLT
jgi:diacylglycerol O-acyltransferase / wax synthase